MNKATKKRNETTERQKKKMWTSHVIQALALCAILSLAKDKSINAIDLSIRPPYDEYAKVARYLVHKSNWTSMGTISSLSTIHGFPMVNVISIADSALDAPSTGHIYFMLTDLDFTGQDLAINNKLTALFTEDQDLSCTTNHTDTMEPTCARVIFVGKVNKLMPNDIEYKQANESFTDRHPASINWRQTHAFYLCKFDIEHIAVLDFYGGPHYVTIDDYYNANYDSVVNDIDDIQPSIVTPKLQ